LNKYSFHSVYIQCVILQINMQFAKKYQFACDLQKAKKIEEN